MKAKIRFVKFDCAIAMQVLEIDERFFGKHYSASNGICIEATGKIALAGKAVYLGDRDCFRDMIACEYFSDNDVMDEHLKEIIFALREWSSNWVGFKEEQSIAPKYDSFDLEL